MAATVRLLDVDPALTWRLREDDRAEARERVRLNARVVPKGELALTNDDHRSRTVGLIVIDGLLLQEIQVGGRHSLQLLGRGDVVLPEAAGPESLEVGMSWVAATDTRVALLDDRLQAPFALWPGLALGLLDRVSQQLARTALHAAIAQLPRVEDRLEAMFWDLADRWGRVTPSGVHLPLQLTHEVLARLVGGRRPTISLALSDLAERGVLARQTDGSWLLTAPRPSLAPNEAPTTRPLVVPTASPPSTTPTRQALEPWHPGVRQELIATAQRISERHVVTVEQVSADLRRYEQTRMRSRRLRDEAARQRARHLARRSPDSSEPVTPDARAVP